MSVKPTPFTYEPEVSSQIYGLHVPYNKGYDAHSQRRRARKRGTPSFARAEDKAASGYLLRGNGAQIALWITDIIADFSLAGQAAQSRMTRQFYPRSFNDVKLHITGNVASTQEYNRLALFVREHQWKALDYINQGGVGTDQTITFGLYDKTRKHYKNAKRNVKGAHRSWQVQGYISTMAAGATAHNVAPEFEIDFIVCDTAGDNLMTGTANTSIWKEFLATGSVLGTFVGLVNQDVKNGDIFTGYIPAPKVTKPAGTSSIPKQIPTALPGVWTTEAAGVPYAPGYHLAVPVPLDQVFTP